MDNWVEIKKDPVHISREKQKARKLRNSIWWKQEISKGLCYYCKKKFAAADLTMDHIIPLARGGKSTKGNCVVCCKECNNKKSFLTPVEIILNKLSNNHKNKSGKE